MVTQSTVCVLFCFIRMDSCLSASWVHAGERCLLRSWCQQGESTYTELNWNGCRGESASCLWGTQIFSKETKAAGAGGSAKQNMKTKSSHDTWWTQTQEEKLPPPHPCFPPACYSSPLAVLQINKTPEEDGKRGADAWIAVAPSWALTRCNAWSLMLPEMFRKMQGSFKENFIGQSKNHGMLVWKNPQQAARNPHASFKRDQGVRQEDSWKQ